MREKLSDSGLSAHVEPFDPDRYNSEATIAENLFFGRATGKEFLDAGAYAHPYARKILADTGLDEKLFAIGVQIARTMHELFADVSADDPLFDQFDFFRPEDMGLYQAALTRLGEAANHILRGDAGRVLAHATSGPCLQQNLVAVMEAE